MECLCGFSLEMSILRPNYLLAKWCSSNSKNRCEFSINHVIIKIPLMEKIILKSDENVLKWQTIPPRHFNQACLPSGSVCRYFNQACLHSCWVCG